MPAPKPPPDRSRAIRPPAATPPWPMLFRMSSISPASADAAIESLLAAKESATQTKIAYAVAAKSMNAQRAAGDAVLALLDAAAPKGAAEGKGANLDVMG